MNKDIRSEMYLTILVSIVAIIAIVIWSLSTIVSKDVESDGTFIVLDNNIVGKAHFNGDFWEIKEFENPVAINELESENLGSVITVVD